MIAPYEEKKTVKRDEWGAWNVMKAKSAGQYTSPCILNNLYQFHGKSMIMVLPFVHNWSRVKTIINRVWQESTQKYEHELIKLNKKLDKQMMKIERMKARLMKSVQLAGEDFITKEDLFHAERELWDIKEDIWLHKRLFAPTFRHLLKSKALPRYRYIAQCFDEYNTRYEAFPDDIDEVLEFILQFDTSKHGREYMKTVGALLGINIH